MKKLLPLLFLLISLTAFSQSMKPIEKGFITITTGQKMEFTNLRFQDNQVVFKNVATKSEFTYFLNSIKIIVDGDNSVIFENKALSKDVLSQEQVIDNKANIKNYTKLEFINAYKVSSEKKELEPNQVRDILKTNSYALEQYNSGRTLATIGDFSIGFGVGFIIAGGLINTNKANSNNSQYQSGESKGSPALIIAGLVIGVVAIPLKIAGRSKVKESIKNYNIKPTTSAVFSKSNINLIASINSMGFNINF